ncbi:hypothetical protein [Methanococcoides alaskense]|uniref:Uncharacterized protein n=1 Tax=Methanococcoides alaskense TaxID=325778 RepID=A0AA90U041_9EURY|nr:hypothetical protein [Methanococcoides alaskense]MDA0524373.1 hypothetical protein [Methanococcoides alaskense]MDR6223187.1 hypothetical protein [Methanococcoides alaskense]
MNIINRFWEEPLEVSLFFIGWFWLGFSIIGMTLANMYLPDSILDIYHLIVGVIYLLPMFVIVLKVFKGRNVAGLPLMICSGIIGVYAIVMHMKLNLGVDYLGPLSEILKIVLLLVLLVAVLVSFYIYARSVGCDNTKNLKIILLISAINGLVIVYNVLFGGYGIRSESVAIMTILFLFVLEPLLGGMYAREIVERENWGRSLRK